MAVSGFHKLNGVSRYSSDLLLFFSITGAGLGGMAVCWLERIERRIEVESYLRQLAYDPDSPLEVSLPALQLLQATTTHKPPKTKRYSQR
jgi:hypothetical protein